MSDQRADQRQCQQRPLGPGQHRTNPEQQTEAERQIGQPVARRRATAGLSVQRQQQQGFGHHQSQNQIDGEAAGKERIHGARRLTYRPQARARPNRWARSLKKIRTWAIGFFRSSFLFMYESKVSF